MSSPAGATCCLPMVCEPSDILEESIRIPAERDELSGVLAYPFAGRPERTALVVGPHPMMGGRIENNVVRAVGRGLAERGFATLRFRFGGAGPSAEIMDEFWKSGHAPDDPRRADDTVAAFRWLQQAYPAPMVAIGYSFGASLLSALCGDPQLSHIAMIGATLAQHDYAAIAASPLPKLVITADNDFATPLENTRAWFEGVREPKRLVMIEAAEHFYRGQEQRLVAEILDWTHS